ncbi:hypothetical protein BABINDRAFT_159511 [Babjeviella inositovora NRRL Y-12698]|uniref:Uncharacterized protein n=1 Tax=Babjeviella inositovora NRRL Y-12698 TaxID=984486 RepID=A0A1E3QZH7_9ASCO|nr:uncharacterized protein BABINDRAFT_159511 [Babjeviella inositovora NRRL Y-12698]ODQ83046.1 hypothetical protein BABINDRAFT_159511 [Babjeviella inositovora NRRL Y-12698]
MEEAGTPLHTKQWMQICVENPGNYWSAFLPLPASADAMLLLHMTAFDAGLQKPSSEKS